MFKKLMIVAILAIAGVAGTAYYYWHQATFLPNWYQKLSENNDNKLSELPPVIVNEKSRGEVKLNDKQFNQFITENLARDQKLEKVLGSTKAIHSEIKDGKLQIGAVVNTANLSEINLPESKRVIVKKLIEKIPQFQNRDIYVAVQGTPQIKDGKIVLSQDSQLQVGNLRFTPAEIAAKLNLPAETIQQQLTLNLQQVNLQGIELNQGEIKLKFRQ